MRAFNTQTKHIAALFDKIAPRYDLLNHLLSFHFDVYWRKLALNAIEIPKDAVILDLCAGTADVAIAAAKVHSNSKVYGLDCSERMLWVGKKKISQRSFEKQIQLLLADALELPFGEKSFDAVFLSFGFRNLHDREQGIQEIARVLKEDASVVILEFPPPQDSLFGFFYRLYLGYVIPFLGKVISKSETAYRYLHSSIEEFLLPEEVIELLRKHGLDVLSTRRLMFGIVYLYVARKSQRTH